MTIESPSDAVEKPLLRGGPWGHFLVSASACILTVSIVGSGVFLVNRIYTRYEFRSRIREFLGSLENRTQQELEQSAAKLQERPKVVEQMLPELTATLRSARSEEQLCAAIRISRPFLGHKRIREALYELRADGRERVAATAIETLGGIEPPEQACEVLGRCLDDVSAGVLGPAATDRLCASLFELGTPGLSEIRSRLAKLSIDRRVWLVGYVATIGGPHRQAWLEMLKGDTEPRVQAAANQALAPAKAEPLVKT